jgi:hypothetical protein
LNLSASALASAAASGGVEEPQQMGERTASLCIDAHQCIIIDGHRSGSATRSSGWSRRHSDVRSLDEVRALEELRLPLAFAPL